MNTITHVVKNRATAQAIFMQLEAVGISERQISLVMTDEARGSHFNLRESSKVDEGTAAGASVGGLVGIIAGAILSAGVIVIPGLNLVVTGALVSSLAGLGAGAVVGGLAGGLIGSGIPEHEAKLYEKELKEGNVLIAVNAENHDQEKAIREIFKTADKQAKEAA